ncbi:MAG: hypothetical protein IT567_00530 [Alphaproteobacteria bacterium]|nr:hypothetical protein [Alphaproteobacteria bacterium]
MFLFEMVGTAFLIAFSLVAGLSLVLLLLLVMPIIAWFASRGAGTMVHTSWYQNTTAGDGGTTVVEGEYREVVHAPQLPEQKTAENG